MNGFNTYYRVMSSLQPQLAMRPAIPPPPYLPLPPPPAPVMSSEILVSASTPMMAPPPMDQGQCQLNSAHANYRHPIAAAPCNNNGVDSNGEGKPSLVEIERDVDSFSQESGCLSDCSESLSPTKSEDRSEDGDGIESVSFISGAVGTTPKGDGCLQNAAPFVDTFQEQSKYKGRKKYYMYGSHKLVKPIKDIPPRFQTLLAEMSAAKQRCEGQLIYIHDFSEHLSASPLNIDANCFIPGSDCMPSNLHIENGTSVSYVPCIFPPSASINKTPATMLHANPSLMTVPPPNYTKPLSVNSAPNFCANCGTANKSPSGDCSHAPLVHVTPPSLHAPTNSAANLQSYPLSNPASSTATNMTSIPPPIPPLSVPPPSLPPPTVPPPLSVPPPPSVHYNTCPQNPAVQVSSHPLPGGGNYYVYHTSSSSTGFTTSPSTPTHSPAVYYVVNPQYPPAPCGYQLSAACQ